MTKTILLAHGSGGEISHELIRDLFVSAFDNAKLSEQGDSAILDDLPAGRVALTTDSYVVKPLIFPGGNIGELAVCGTVNDLAVMGARPLYLTAGFILEEGLDYDMLHNIVASMAATARAAGRSRGRRWYVYQHGRGGRDPAGSRPGSTPHTIR